MLFYFYIFFIKVLYIITKIFGNNIAVDPHTKKLVDIISTIP